MTVPAFRQDVRRKPVLLCIGERVHAPEMPRGQVQSWKAHWTDERPTMRLRCIMSTPAMTHGPTRSRLVEMTGDDWELKVVNLLWPDRVPGTWDRAEAMLSALCLLENRHRVMKNYDAVVTLGCKVLDVMMLGTKSTIGTVWAGGDGMPPMAALPHPSGRSQFLNTCDGWNVVRSAMRELYDLVQSDRRTCQADGVSRDTGGASPQDRA